MKQKEGEFMKNVFKLLLIGLFLAFVFGVAVQRSAKSYYDAQAKDLEERAKIAEQKIQEIQAKELADEKLGQYTINQMYQAGAQNKLSKAKMQVLARAIVRVANDIYTNEDNKKAFIMVIAIESAFNRFAQSPTGPKGYGQLAKASFKEAMNDCGMTDVNEEDVWEQDLNLYAAACYYKKLLNQRNGDTYASAIAYNQGPNSLSDKTYRKNGRLEEKEPMQYLSKFSFLHRNVKDVKQPNVPSFSELPVAKIQKVTLTEE